MSSTQNQEQKPKLELGTFRKHVLTDFLQLMMFDFGGGRDIVQARHVINVQKGGTIVFCIFLMTLYQNFSYGALLYTALHGSYGILWIFKDYTFPDKSWEQPFKIGSLGICICALLGYWIAPFYMISKVDYEPSPERCFWSVILYCLGVSLMLVADCQKYYTLKYKKGLISDGVFYYTRNPNYLGEFMLYAAFSILVNEYEAWIVPVFMWTVLFNITMLVKDHNSLSRKEGWEEYKKRSNIFLPKFYQDNRQDRMFYTKMIFVFYAVYRNGGIFEIINFKTN